MVNISLFVIEGTGNAMHIRNEGPPYPDYH